MLLTAMVIAQGSGASQPVPAFDVASVKPSESPGEEPVSLVQPGGRYVARNVTVRLLLKSAYGLHDDQVIGGPAWINSDRFDIVAKAEGYPSASAFRDQARLMLRPLLADRFKLVVTRERRTLPVYALLVANADGRLGPQLRRSGDDDCAITAKTYPAPPDAAEPALPLPCGAEVYRAGHLAARRMALSNLTLSASRWSDRLVVDRTGLEGTFDWELQWSPDDLTPDASHAPQGPSLFAALRDQAGLRIESSRAPIEVLVVKSIARPEPD